MKSIILRSLSLAAVASLPAPAGLWAHVGHGAEHGWLAGAAQPFLSLDHLLAGASVALVVGCVSWSLARVMRDRVSGTAPAP